MKAPAVQPDKKAPNPLGTAPIAPLIAKYAVPSIISMLVMAAYNITDQIFIGRTVGMLGNAATNVAFPMSMLSSTFALLIGIGTAANFNICMGEKKEDAAAQFLGTGLVVLLSIGVLFMGTVFIFKTHLLLLCGATPSVFPFANAYLGITAFGIPFFTFTQAAAYLIRADGRPAYSMLCSSAGAVLNVFLDWLFLFYFKMGIGGAALATVIGQFVSFVLCAFYFTQFKSFKVRLTMFAVNVPYLIKIVKLGSSNFINHIIMSTVMIVMNNTLKYYGGLSAYGSDIPLAVSGVIAKLSAILTGITVGLAQGCQPIFGFNAGAKNYARVKETYKKACIATLTVSVTVFLIFQIFPRAIISIFGVGDESYFEFAEKYLRIFLMMVCVHGMQPLTVTYFTATGKAKPAALLSLSRQGFFLIPLLVTLPMIFGLNGALYAGPIADTLAFLLSVVLVVVDFKRMPVV
ncbi:MAG: MATE family efflux transporter [Spirochaetaceae bacterium]|jgi:putative MATE family efflux protein|nr:MATE family efflux transporter [Spirochaetaceae bacterium]